MTKTMTPSDLGPPHAPALLGVAWRVAMACCGVLAGVGLLGHAWRSAEADLVRRALSAIGVAQVTRVGDELLVRPTSGSAGFVLDVGTWCSAIGPVLVFGAAALLVPGIARHRRWRAWSIASSVVLVGNLLRMIGTGWIGAHRGAASIEPFHDGLATAFAVTFLLAGLSMFAWVLIGPAQPPTPLSISSAALQGSSVRSNT